MGVGREFGEVEERFLAPLLEAVAPAVQFTVESQVGEQGGEG